MQRADTKKFERLPRGVVWRVLQSAAATNGGAVAQRQPRRLRLPRPQLLCDLRHLRRGGISNHGNRRERRFAQIESSSRRREARPCPRLPQHRPWSACVTVRL